MAAPSRVLKLLSQASQAHQEEITGLRAEIAELQDALIAAGLSLPQVGSSDVHTSSVRRPSNDAGKVVSIPVPALPERGSEAWLAPSDDLAGDRLSFTASPSVPGTSLQEDEQEDRQALKLQKSGQAEQPGTRQSRTLLPASYTSERKLSTASVGSSLSIPGRKSDDRRISLQSIEESGDSRRSQNYEELPRRKISDAMPMQPSFSETSGSYFAQQRPRARSVVSEDLGDVGGQIQCGLLDVWQTGGSTSRLTSTVGKKRSSMDSHISEGSDPGPTFIASCLTSGSGSFLNRYVMNPNSGKRMCYDIFGLVLMLWDLIWLPVQVFNPGVNALTEMLGWTTTIYWTGDIFMSFFLGYTIKLHGETELRLHKTAANYLRSMFVFDFIVVAIDWFLTIMTIQQASAEAEGQGSSRFSVVRFGRVLRFLRLLRLLRLFKAHGLINDLLKHIQSDASIILIGIAKLLIFIMLLNHLIACVWFAIGSIDLEREDTWIKEHMMGAKPIEYQYLTALHWSFCQFTPASMEVMPYNELERLFAVLVIVSAMVIFSSFVSTITNAMNQLRNLNSERNKNLTLLRTYFKENKISTRLVSKISDCLAQALQTSQRRLREQDVVILDILPASLRTQLMEEVYTPHLAVHPFFSKCSMALSRDFKRLVSVGLKTCTYSITMELIAIGEKGTHMYFILDGMLQYTMDDSVPTSVLHAKSWLVEAALWLDWKHRGTATCMSNCDFIAIDALKVQEIFKDEVVVRSYAVQFAKHFQRSQVSDIFDNTSEINRWTSLAAEFAESSAADETLPDLPGGARVGRATYRQSFISRLSGGRESETGDGMVQVNSSPLPSSPASAFQVVVGKAQAGLRNSQVGAEEPLPPTPGEARRFSN